MEQGDLINAVNATAGILSEVIDRFFPYCGLTKRALDVYIAEIEKSDKPKEYKAWEVLRAKQEFRKLKNINSIVELAQEYCTDEEIDNSSYSDNEEWYDRFFEKAGSVSEESVQRIWGQILANEFKHKGTTPRTVIGILSEIDSELAKRFSTLCEHRLIVAAMDNVDSSVCAPFITEVMYFGDDEYYIKKGLDLQTLNELEAIGLISTSGFGYVKRISNIERVLISDGVFTDCIVLKDHELRYGTVMLTKAGRYLLDIIEPSIAHDQHELIVKYFSKYGYEFKETSKRIQIINKRHIHVTDAQQ